MTEPSIMPEHNREKGAHATQHNALRQVTYKERPKIDAEQQWMEPGKAFLALFIAEPELTPKTVKAPGALRDLRNKYAAVIQEFLQLPSIMPTLKRRIDGIGGAAPQWPSATQKASRCYSPGGFSSFPEKAQEGKGNIRGWEPFFCRAPSPFFINCRRTTAEPDCARDGGACGAPWLRSGGYAHGLR